VRIINVAGNEAVLAVASVATTATSTLSKKNNSTSE
jgi:hypothetical protein